MKRIRLYLFTSVAIFAFVLVIAQTVTFANSCCGVKKGAFKGNKQCVSGCVEKVSANEESGNICPVCGQRADSKGQEVETKHAGKTVHLCCEGCLNAYNQNPDKYTKVERHEETHRNEPPKKKQRGESYY